MTQQLWKYDFDIDVAIKCHVVVREYVKNNNSYIEIDYSFGNINSLDVSLRDKIKNNVLNDAIENIFKQLANV